MKKRSAVIVGLFALGSAGLSSCSSSSPSSSDSSAVVSSERTGSFNDDDVMFAQMMIPHHEQAIELSDMALDPSIGAINDITQLATQIKGAQDPEITQMTQLLTSWGKPVGMDEGMDHSAMMGGMLTAAELAQIETLRGSAFDKAWAQAMIKHHEGAVTMAQDVLAKGLNQEIRTLAQAIISSQTEEIAALQKLIQ